MSERRKVLEKFEQQRDFTDERVNFGIENYRKGVAEINLVDKDGNPVTDAEITAVQKDHEFRFGANLFMLDELETEEKNEKYKKAFSGVFNMATLPFYWDATEPEKGHTRYAKDSEKIYRRPAIDLCMEFCEKHGIEPREHALAYDKFFPKWLSQASVSEVKAAFVKRCEEISERYKEKIPTIEVTNEMLWGEGEETTSFYNEPDFVEWCFKTAEKYFPGNKLTINECNHPCWIESCRPAANHYYSYIENAVLKGARIDSIGFQYHMFRKSEDEYEATRQFYDPQNLYRHMDFFAQLGKPLQLTEITIPAYSNSEEDEKLQAEIITNLYRIWFSHKNVEQIVYWNLADGYAAFAPQGDMTVGENYYYGGLLRFDMTPKPAYFAIKNLIEKEWHTEEKMNSDKDGKAKFKGFFGNYDIQISSGEKTVNKTIRLQSKAKNKFTVEI